MKMEHVAVATNYAGVHDYPVHRVPCRAGRRGDAGQPCLAPSGAADLNALVAEELSRPVASPVRSMAAAIAALHPGARAVLFYGACLRETRLEGRILDFYLIVADYDDAYDRPWLAGANRLLPPNVFPFQQGGLAAKYAVLSEADFTRLACSATRNVSVWARFAQPSRLAWCVDAAAAARAVSAVAGAAPALLAAARPCAPDRIKLLDLWSLAFQLTYAAELRPERDGRGLSIVESDPGRYRTFTALALAQAGIGACVDGEEIVFARPSTPELARIGIREWGRRRREGKALNLLRLIKASATYSGGLDYLASKIARHSGVRPVIRPWQRRWPILGAICHLPGLFVRGVIR